VYFFAGEGPQPSSKGFVVPDELGYINALGKYEDKDVLIQLPGQLVRISAKFYSPDFLGIRL
jgi:hypothetical protein